MQTANNLEKLLDLMTDQLLDRQEVAFSESVLNWYRNNYQCAQTPKPTDLDEVRLAVKASILERLVEVLNSPPRNETQKIPSWVKDIKGVKEPIKLQSDRLLEGEEYSEAFKKRNLYVVKNFMFFI